ncbi:MAG: NHL repeat-containing protein [Acidimicrobiia bacterium]
MQRSNPGTTGRRGARLLAVVASVAVVALAPIAGSAPARADSGTPPTKVATLGGPGHAELYTSGLEVAPDGGVVMANTGDAEVKKYSPTGTLIWKVGQYGSGVGNFNDPRDIGIDSGGNIYVADTANTRVVKLDASGNWVKSWDGPSNDKIKSPIGISVHNNVVYVADGNAKKVRVYDTDGNHLRSFGSNGTCTFAALRDVDADSDGNVYVANYTNNNILKLTSTGTCIAKWGTKGTADGQFKNPYGVRLATDPVAGKEWVYVADSNNNRIQIFAKDGTFVAVVGFDGNYDQPGAFGYLRRVAVSAQGDVWGADLWDFQAEKYARTPTGWSYALTVGSTRPGTSDNAVFNQPRGIGFDSAGNLAVMDTVHHRVVRMNPSGHILNICGGRADSDSNGYFNWPRAVDIDRATGEMWVVDTKQYRVQILKPDCTFVTKFGTNGTGNTNFNWPMGIAIRQSDRVAFIADTQNNRIVAYDVATRTFKGSIADLPAAAGGSKFNSPRGVAMNPSNGRVLVADRGNNRVVELSYAGGTFTWTRNYTDGFSKLEGVAADSTGRVYVADTNNNRMVVLGPSGSELAVVTNPAMFQPSAVAVDANDVVYLSDTFHDVVQKYSYGGPPVDPTQPPQVQSTLAGPGLADMYPVDIAADASYYYVLDAGGYRVLKVRRSDGAIVAMSGGHQGSGPGDIGAARAIDVDSSGNVYVADTPNQRVEKFDANLNFVSEWGSLGSGNGQFKDVYGIAVGPGLNGSGQPAEVVYAIDAQGGPGRVQKFLTNGTYVSQFANGAFNQPRQADIHPGTHDLYVVDARAGKVRVFDENGNARTPEIGKGNGTGPGRFQGDPRGIAFSPDGTKVYVSDQGNYRVQVFNALVGPPADDGVLQFAFGQAGTAPSDFNEIRGLAMTPDGVLVVCDQWAYALKEFQTDGTFIQRRFGGGPPVGGVNTPRGLATDASGRIYASDWWNQRIQRWNANGSSPIAWGYRGQNNQTGSVNFAWGLTVQPGTGRVFLANRESHEIEVFDADGNYVTRWGTRGTANGQFQFPQGIAFDPTDGTVVVSDSQNNRVQRFSVDAGGNGTFVTSYGSAGNWSTGGGFFNTPSDIDVAADGTIWVADTLNNRIQKRDKTSGTWTVFKKPVNNSNFTVPWGVTVAPDGSIWVADSGANRIVKMDPNGNMFFAADGAALGTSELRAPYDVAFSQGKVYLSDTWNNRILQLG